MVKGVAVEKEYLPNRQQEYQVILERSGSFPVNLLCEKMGIKSQAKRCQYKRHRALSRVYPNLLLAEMQSNGPLQCVVSEMIVFYAKGVYHELTLYMDLWNNEIVAHSLSAKRGDRTRNTK